MMAEKIRVLIVDDSAFMREAIREVLSADLSIEVVGFAKDGVEGIKKVLELKPNVMTIDLNMPGMDGMKAIEKIMEECPTPIIVISNRNIQDIVKALGTGAMDFVAVTHDINEVSKDLINKVKIASRVTPIRRIKMCPPIRTVTAKTTKKFKILAIGVSTGGPQALQVILSQLPKDLPAGLLVVQHIAAGFIDGLVGWLSMSCCLDIRVAKAGDVLKKGMVLFAPDNCNMTIDRQAKIGLKEDISRKMLHVPCIDEMMGSVAVAFGTEAIGVIMTGMGQDGAEGIKAIKNAGGYTLAQDKKSSVVFSMNKVAIETGCVDKVVPVDKIAREIMTIVDANYCE
ncbi:MAG: chemotaxis-specific protein-glutamate methyltransferase CheB [Candidatus Omnitrophota bacterium]